MTVLRAPALPPRSGALALGLAATCAVASVFWQQRSSGAAPAPSARSRMVPVPAGTYQPFYEDEAGGRAVPVAPLAIDVEPVSRAAFLSFVEREPSFRRSRIERLFAEPGYLADWRADLEPGQDLDAPVVYVSWFAAKAYCEHVGKRLPTTAEWERCAGRAANVAPDGAEPRGSPFGFAMGKAEPELGAAAFGRVWEWTSDFNSVLVSGRLGDDSSGSAFCGDGVRATDPADYGAFLRYSFRASLKGNYTLKRLGFRCAKSAS